MTAGFAHGFRPRRRPRRERDELSGAAYASRVVGFFIVALLVLAAVIGIVALYAEQFSDLDWRILTSVMAVALFSVTALEGAHVVRREDDPAAPIGALALLVSLIALSLVLYVLWGPSSLEEGGEEFTIFEAAYISTVWSVALGHIALLMGRRDEQDGRVVKALLAAAVGFTVGLATILSVALTAPGFDLGSGFEQTVGAMAILAVLCSLLHPIVRSLQRQTNE